MNNDTVIAWAAVATASATFILGIITYYVAHLTFEKQNKDRTIASFEKKLEQVYCPMEEAITTFKLEKEELVRSNNNQAILFRDISRIFDKLTDRLLRIKRNYGYLIDNEVTNFHQQVWNAKRQFDADNTTEKMNNLVSLINPLHDIITRRINEYNTEINRIQGISSTIRDENNIMETQEREQQIHDRERIIMTDEKTDGFKFAITALTAIGTSLFVVNNYFQNNAVDVKYYIPTVSLISDALLLLLFLLIYIFIKGALIELPSSVYPNLKKKYGTLASFIYSIAFLLFLMIFTIVFWINIFLRLGFNIYEYQPIILSLSLLSSEFLGLPNIIHISEYLKFPKFKFIEYLDSLLDKALSKLGLEIIITKLKKYEQTINKVSKIFYIFISLFLISLILLSLLIPLVLISPLQGQVTIDMEMIYHKTNASIPVTIQLTGPNTGFSVNLSKKSNGSGLIPIDSIPKLEPYHNQTNVTLSDKSIIFGNSMENGKYNVFINTTDLSEGYYELKATRIFYEKMDVKGFYLLNANEK